MKPIARVEAMLAGEPVDRPPFCLYPAYNLDWLGGEVLHRAMEAFVERVEPDVVALPYVYSYSLPANLSLDRLTDLAGIEAVHGRHGDWSHQVDALRSLCGQYFGKRWVAAVVPSAYKQLEHLIGGELLREGIEQQSGFLFQALDRLNQSLCSLIRTAVDQGAQMVVVEETGASHEWMSPKLYRERLLPGLEAQAEAAGRARFVLQLQGRRLFWEELKLQQPSWGLGWPLAAGPGLVRGATRWPGFLWGGLDPTDWSQASSAWLRGGVRQQLSDFPERPIILATPGPLGPLRLDQWEALAHGLRRLPSPERLRETPEEMEERRAARPPRPVKRREEREAPQAQWLEAPKPPKGVRTRLHEKVLPKEPSSSVDADQWPGEDPRRS